MREDDEIVLTAFELLSRQPEGRHLAGRPRLLCGHPKEKKKIYHLNNCSSHTTTCRHPRKAKTGC